MLETLPPALRAYFSQTPEEQIAAITQYNLEAWPAHILAVAGMLGAYELTRSHRHHGSSLLLLVLAAAWAWVGYSYLGQHLGADGEPMGLFLVQSGLLLIVSLTNPKLRGDTASARAGHALVIVAVFVLPLITLLSGRPVTEIAFFGLTPGPTALATLGAILVLSGWLRWILVVIPAAWIILMGLRASHMGSEALLVGPVLAGLAILIAILGHGRQEARAQT